MEVAFYIAAAIAIIATVLMLTGLNVVHALLYLIVSLLAVAVVFYVIGAPFVAALEVIIYAGAIMVLFVFVVMMLNLGEHAVSMEKAWLTPGIWIGPTVLAGLLLCEVAYVVAQGGGAHMGAGMVESKQVGIVLLGPYVIGVELASMLLLAGLVGAYHLGARTTPRSEIRNARDTHTRWAAPRRDSVLPGTDRPARTP
ncbi:MAG: NADH-quinone oxidoreductase subunit J [Nitrospirota bacterium]|nr:NADH-quinone oxidoreductase subunit J [Nitrospirota bacterium]MDE3218519.1 NADH-quinone oxidoreductase subunit J [Nitrospirota bacterium]